MRKMNVAVTGIGVAMVLGFSLAIAGCSDAPATEPAPVEQSAGQEAEASAELQAYLQAKYGFAPSDYAVLEDEAEMSYYEASGSTLESLDEPVESGWRIATCEKDGQQFVVRYAVDAANSYEFGGLDNLEDPLMADAITAAFTSALPDAQVTEVAAGTLVVNGSDKLYLLEGVVDAADPYSAIAADGVVAISAQAPVSTEEQQAAVADALAEVFSSDITGGTMVGVMLFDPSNPAPNPNIPDYAWTNLGM